MSTSLDVPADTEVMILPVAGDAYQMGESQRGGVGRARIHHAASRSQRALLEKGDMNKLDLSAVNWRNKLSPDKEASIDLDCLFVAG